MPGHFYKNLSRSRSGYVRNKKKSMAMNTLYNFLPKDRSPNSVNAAVRQQILDNWDHIAMPLDGMGVFRRITAQIGGILEDANVDIQKKAVLVLCADNGIVEEGVSQTGQEVTRIVAEGMGRGQSTVCLMANQIGARVIPVDAGINCTEAIPGILDRKIRCGSRNFLKQPAMTPQETTRALRLGLELAADCKQQGYRILATGEMGIGNTTTSSTVAAALLGEPPEVLIGRGAGLSDSGLFKKKQAAGTAIRKYHLYEQDAFTVLQIAGGYDLAALAGICMGGCLYRLPVVLDGVISMTAALIAVRLLPETQAFLIPSHLSREPAAARLAEALELQPVICAEMALGEGSGAVMMLSLLDMVLAVYSGLRTFAQADIAPYERFV